MSFFSNCFGSKTEENSTVSTPQMKNKPSDEEIIRFENELRSTEAAHCPLVTPLLPLAVLQDELDANSNFALKISLLQSQHNYTEMRKCRRDGNCFYRAVAFELIEIFKKDPQAAKAKYQEAWKEKLQAAHYEPAIYEDFSEAFWSYTEENSDSNDPLNTQEMWEKDEYTSNMALMLIRLLTSAQIRSNPDDYLAFIELAPQDANSIEKWCERNVDAVGVDADQVQLIALAKTIEIALVVANLGGGMDSDDLQVNEFDFKANESDPQIHLLYRPGHYDLLYKQAQ